eukprot:2576389-Amphidinium_carterae.1
MQRFGTVFDMLGVTVDLSGFTNGVVSVRNKRSRIEGMTTGLQEILDNDSMSAHTAASLKGKLSFMEGQHHARLGVVTTRALSLRALGSNREVSLTHELRAALQWSLDLLSTDLGKEIPLRRQEYQVVIFTDGAVEGEGSGTCTIGGVAFFPSKRPEYFSSHVPDVLVNAWKSEGRKHVIFHTELLPVMVSQLLWSCELEGRLALFFVDNEAARCSLVASQTGLKEAMKIVWASLSIVARHSMRPWYARVPSSCNVADGPSRGDHSEVERLWGATRVATPDFMSCLVASKVLFTSGKQVPVLLSLQSAVWGLRGLPLPYLPINNTRIEKAN